MPAFPTFYCVRRARASVATEAMRILSVYAFSLVARVDAMTSLRNVKRLFLLRFIRGFVGVGGGKAYNEIGSLYRATQSPNGWLYQATCVTLLSMRIRSPHHAQTQVNCPHRRDAVRRHHDRTQLINYFIRVPCFKNRYRTELMESRDDNVVDNHCLTHQNCLIIMHIRRSK